MARISSISGYLAWRCQVCNLDHVLAGGGGCDIGAFEVLAEPDVDPSLFADGFESGTDLLWSSPSR